MKKILYNRPDGGLSIIKPIISQDDPAGFTEQQALERALVKDVPSYAINVRVVDNLNFADKTFRNAWVDAGITDMPKARTIHRDNLRALRAPKFGPLDIEWMKYITTGDAVRAAFTEAKRQALRDALAFSGIDSAQTPEELKTAIPDCLK